MKATAEQFIRAWQQGTSIRAIALSLRMREDACRSRASLYRSKGIPLKKFSSRQPWAERRQELIELAKALVK